MNDWHNLTEQKVVKSVVLVDVSHCQQYVADMLGVVQLTIRLTLQRYSVLVIFFRRTVQASFDCYIESLIHN